MPISIDVEHYTCMTPLYGVKSQQKLSVQDIVDALTRSDSKLTSLTLTKYFSGDEEAQQIFTALAHPNCQLSELNFSFNGISHEGLKALVEVCEHTEELTLSALNLTGNNLGTRGAEMLASVLLMQNCSLTSLRLRGCHLSKSGASALADALQSNTSLKDLDLRSNELATENGDEFLAVLKDSNHILQTLKLDEAETEISADQRASFGSWAALCDEIRPLPRYGVPSDTLRLIEACLDRNRKFQVRTIKPASAASR